MDLTDRPEVTAADLMRVVSDALRSGVDGGGFDAWLEREGLADDAALSVVVAICDWMQEFHTRRPRFDRRQRERILVLFAFSTGWDAHRELRGEAPPLDL